MNGLELPRSALCCTSFAHGFVADVRHPLDFHTIQLALAGNIQFSAGHHSVDSNIETGVMLSAGQRVKVTSLPGNICLSYIVKDEVIRDVLSAWTGCSTIPPLVFQPQFNPQEPRTASLLSLLRNFVAEIDRPGGVLESPAAVASFEHTLITVMLFGLEHNLSEQLRSPSAEAGTDQCREVEEYLEANATKPIDMRTLSRLTGHSTDSIYRDFRRHREYTPMEFLAMVRMRLARQRLVQASPPSSVTKIAMDCGFTHLGRFAAEYRRRFGETPSQTLKRAAAPADRVKR